MTKVVKVYLISKVKDINNKEIEYKEICRILHKLQDETRSIKNKTITLCQRWLALNMDFKAIENKYLKDKDTLGMTLDGYLYDKLKNDTILVSSNLNASVRDASKKFNASKKAIIKGEKVAPTYKKNQPLDIYNKNISLEYKEGDFFITLSLLNKNGKALHNIDRFRFEAVVKDNSTKEILERCYDGIYKISASKLIWDDKKKMWKINLAFTFENNPNTQNLDEDKVLGINLGIVKPIVASVYGDRKCFSIECNEIEMFRSKHESRKRSLQRATKHCGDGKIGHGTKCRTKAVYKAKDKMARFTDTTNYKYAKAVVDYAKRNNCGKIAIENLTSISEISPYLKNWSYFDLQTKIEHKAQEAGIEIMVINPAYLSQRCSKCGHISKENRPYINDKNKSLALFKCVNCGFETDADYNASQNCATPDIESIIKEYCKKYDMKYVEKNK